MRYYNITETINKTGISRASIYRFYKNNPTLKSETRKKGGKKAYPESHINQLAKNSVYSEKLDLENENRQLKKLVDLLQNPETLEYKLYTLDWDWFGTVAFRNDYSSKASYHKMAQVCFNIMEKFGDEIHFKMLFTIEPFINRDGTHLHFLMKVDKEFFIPVKEEICNYFKGNRLDFRKYDKYKPGIFYIAKNGLKSEEWDIMG